MDYKDYLQHEIDQKVKRRKALTDPEKIKFATREINYYKYIHKNWRSNMQIMVDNSYAIPESMTEINRNQTKPFKSYCKVLIQSLKTKL